MLSYRVTLDVPIQLVLCVSGLLADRRREIGTRNGTRVPSQLKPQDIEELIEQLGDVSVDDPNTKVQVFCE